ncbi:MAG: hypothetical protein KDD19_05150, partial [Phaeodactylibacter sp.]|nr:hypothetical protein [Phaeodactylibacter sp.]
VSASCFFGVAWHPRNRGMMKRMKFDLPVIFFCKEKGKKLVHQAEGPMNFKSWLSAANGWFFWTFA